MSLFMRRQDDIGEAFRNDPQLQQFVLNDVTATGRLLGTGSYGSVEEVQYRHLICAGKKLHEALLDIENEGVAEVVQKYFQECQLMSSLRHPNITQFLGLCFLPGTQLPLLVMECLETSLDDLLEHMPNLSLSLKRSVLEDVSSGLLYLHKMEPPIIHRDLTSKNVLLTSSLVAKITDMGNSRILDRPTRTLSGLPGTFVYMPPEAMNDSYHYGPSLDIFSFGHLGLYTITQTFPGELLPSTFPNPDNPEEILARNEVERRDQYIQHLEAQISQLHPALVQLVKQCLQNAPNLRPSTEELLTRLQGMRAEVEGQYGNGLMMDVMIKLKMAKEMKSRDRQILELTQQQERQETELELRGRHVEELQAEVQAKACLNDRLQNQIADKDVQLGGFMMQLQTKNGCIDELQAEVQLKNSQIAENQQIMFALREELHSKEVENSRLRDELRQLQSQPQVIHDQFASVQLAHQNNNSKIPFKLLPLELQWRRGPDMPFEMGGYVQSVIVQGKVYVGGGFALSNEVMEYDRFLEKWGTLLQYRATSFAMTVIMDQLVLVGGWSGKNATKEMSVWNAGIEWTHPYPEMPTARSNCSAVAHNQWLVVVGGETQKEYLSSIQLLNIDTKEWHAGPQLPSPLSSMKTAVAENSFHFMGGLDDGSSTDKVYSADIQALIFSINSEQEQVIWKEIPSLHLYWSTPLSISGSLFAVGGKDPIKDEVVSTIYLYQSSIAEWVKVGDLPSARCDCTCVMNTQRELLVFGGGGSKDFIELVPLKRLDIATFP